MWTQADQDRIVTEALDALATARGPVPFATPQEWALHATGASQPVAEALTRVVLEVVEDHGARPWPDAAMMAMLYGIELGRGIGTREPTTPQIVLPRSAL